MSTQVVTVEAYVTDWAKLLLTIPQATDVYLVGTSAWYGSDSQVKLVPNFIIRTTDPFWDSIDGLPVGRAAHDLVAAVNRKQAREFDAKWSATGLLDQYFSGPIGLFDTWALVAQEIRIVEVPSSANWAGPEFLRKVEGGTSIGGDIYQTALRRFDSVTGTLLPAAHYYACSSPVQPVH